MNKWLLVLTLSLWAQGGVWAAECPPGSTLQLIGQFRGSGSTAAGSQQITAAGALVKMVTVACGGTACTSTLYDVDGNNDSNDSTGVAGLVDGNVRLEPGAPANQSFTQVFDVPMQFVDGIVSHDDGNVSGVGAYSCR